MSAGDIIQIIFVAIFAITALIAILDLSGLWEIKDKEKSKYLFKFLILEVVVISLAFVGKNLIPDSKEKDNFALNKGLSVDGVTGIPIQFNEAGDVLLPKKEISNGSEPPEGKNCVNISFADMTVSPPVYSVKQDCNGEGG